MKRNLRSAFLVLTSLGALSGCGSGGSGNHPMFPLQVSPGGGALIAAQNTPYTATITASYGAPPYTFKLDPTSAALPPGLTFSATGNQATISGTPTALGSTTDIIVDVTDSESPAVTIRAAYIIMITTQTAEVCRAGGGPTLFGQYAFVLKGFDNSGNPALVGGVLNFFTYNGNQGSGLITSGEIDMNLNSGVQTSLPVAGIYGILPDGRGCMSLVTSVGTLSYRLSAGAVFNCLTCNLNDIAVEAHIIDFDTTGPFTTGLMLRQTGGPFSTSEVTGSFAFGGSSIQNSAVCNSGICGGKVGLAGVMTFDGKGGITSGSEDINQNGILDGDATLTTWPATCPINFNSAGSSYSMASNGRGTLTIALSSSGGTSHDILYLVSSGYALFMSSDPQTTSTIVAGSAAQQSGGPFSGASLSGAYVGYDSGLGGTKGTTAVELFQVNVSNPNISGTSVDNDGGIISSAPITGVTYTVASTGRTVTAGGGGHSLLLYLVSPPKSNAAERTFILKSNSRVDSGEVFSQIGAPAVSGYVLGGIDPEDAAVVDQVAAWTLNSGSAENVIDTNKSGTLNPNQLSGFTYSVDSTGLGLSPSGCTISATSTNCQRIFWVDGGEMVMIEVAPGLMNPSIVDGFFLTSGLP